MITKKASDKEKFLGTIYFLNAARTGWECVLKLLGSSARVLLPSYIGITDREGSGIFDPIINVGAEYDFYEINNDLSVPLESIKRKSGKQILISFFLSIILDSG